MKHFLAITITLLPSAALAQQFTPEQLIGVMTKSPSNRDVRVHDDRLGGGDSDFDDLIIGFDSDG